MANTIESSQHRLGERIQTAFQSASQQTGTSFEYLVRTAQRESNFDPYAQAATSSAAGLFQFIESTWLQTMKQSGHEIGLGQYADHIQKDARGRYHVDDPAIRQDILNLRFDTNVASHMAGRLTASNADYLQSRLGREATPGELYVAHFMGAGGAVQLISQATNNPDQSAADLFPAQARANKPIFYKDGSARSVEDVYKVLTAKHRDVSSTFAVAEAGSRGQSIEAGPTLTSWPGMSANSGPLPWLAAHQTQLTGDGAGQRPEPLPSRLVADYQSVTLTQTAFVTTGAPEPAAPQPAVTESETVIAGVPVPTARPDPSTLNPHPQTIAADRETPATQQLAFASSSPTPPSGEQPSNALRSRIVTGWEAANGSGTEPFKALFAHGDDGSSSTTNVDPNLVLNYASTSTSFAIAPGEPIPSRIVRDYQRLDLDPDVASQNLDQRPDSQDLEPEPTADGITVDTAASNERQTDAQTNDQPGASGTVVGLEDANLSATDTYPSAPATVGGAFNPLNLGLSEAELNELRARDEDFDLSLTVATPVARPVIPNAASGAASASVASDAVLSNLAQQARAPASSSAPSPNQGPLDLFQALGLEASEPAGVGDVMPSSASFRAADTVEVERRRGPIDLMKMVSYLRPRGGGSFNAER